MSDVEKYDLAHHLEQAVQELDAHSIELANAMSTASLDQLWGFHDHPDSHSTNIRTLIPR